MTRQEEVLDLLESSPSEDIFDKHSRLEEAEQGLRQQWTYGHKETYNNCLTELNFAIWEATGLTDPDDLAIAREIVDEAYTERTYREGIDGAVFSDSD